MYVHIADYSMQNRMQIPADIFLATKKVFSTINDHNFIHSLKQSLLRMWICCLILTETSSYVSQEEDIYSCRTTSAVALWTTLLSFFVLPPPFPIFIISGVSQDLPFLNRKSKWKIQILNGFYNIVSKNLA